VSQKALATGVTVGLSRSSATIEAVREASRQAAEGLGGGEADLAYLFLSPDHLADAAEGADALRDELAPEHLVGCVSESVVAGPKEIEEGPAAVVWAASLPGAQIETFHATGLETEEGVAVAGLPALEELCLVTVIADPFTFPAGPLLARLNEDHSGTPLVGGLATGGGEPGAQALVVDDDVHTEGAVGAVLSNVAVEAVVSQGCSPIGTDAVITRSEGNIVFELAGRPALERLRDELVGLPRAQQELAANGLLAGVVIDENRSEYRRGDYLMRGVLGADEATGALALGDQVRVGQTLRFHVRDAGSADEDLKASLEDLGKRPTVGALLFTCNGRGRRMFAEPDHDARLVSRAVGGSGVAGFFCAGEIGPVGDKTFLHGFTATMAVFLERQ